MKGKVTCQNCGWSWNKSDSSKKDMYICHECGKDNSNNMENGGWLDNYANGGTMQEYQENYNDSSVSLPKGFVGMGYDTKGRNYSPAWGGSFQGGGKLKFLQPISDKLPEGYRIPYSDPSSERAMSIGGENGEPAYLIPSFKYGRQLDDPIGEFKKTGEHLGGPFKTWQEAEEWEKTVRHPAVEKKETIMFPQEKFQMGGSVYPVNYFPEAQGGMSIPGAGGHFYARYEQGGDIDFSYPRTKGIPSNGKYAKKTMASAKNGGWLDRYEDGGVIKDDRGQWDYPGEITEIGSNQITMQGVPYPVLGISDTGDTQMMYPEEEYEFDGEKVTEYPIAKNGLRQEQKGLVNLDQLTNFTNYNKPQPGGWLNKYN